MEWRMQFNMWWTRYVQPWIAETVKPYHITRRMAYQRSSMLYWGVVAER